MTVNSQHFTPEEMALDFARESLRVLFMTRSKLRRIRVLDPACGNGELLRAVSSAASKEGVHVDQTGVDIDPRFDMSGNGTDFLKLAPTSFDLVVMNPPYLGGPKISGELGHDYLKMLKRMHGPRLGNADLSAHFIRHASRFAPNISCIATNTIAQGYTRRVGLAHLYAEGWEVLSATTDLKWPGSAQVTVSLFHAARLK